MAITRLPKPSVACPDWPTEATACFRPAGLPLPRSSSRTAQRVSLCKATSIIQWSFYVPSFFCSLQTREYYVRVTVRRVAAGNVGMNLIYEVADSQGRTPYRNPGNGLVSDRIRLADVHLARPDACFAKMWGYDFSIRPEQSSPFVIGKVEVSTEPFK